MDTKIISNKFSAIFWLILIFILLGLASRKELAFDTNLMALLPESKQEPILQQANIQIADQFEQRLILLVSAADEDSVRRAVALSAEAFTNNTHIADIKWQANLEELKSYQDQFYPYRYSIVDFNTREHLVNNDFEFIKNRALTNLFSPLSIGTNNLAEDPFGLFNEFIRNQSTNYDVYISNSYIKLRNAAQPTYMLILTLAGSSFSQSMQDYILSTVSSLKTTLQQQNSTLKISGMLLHAAAGANQAKKEIRTVGLGSLVGIVLMMLFVFRRAHPLMLALTSASIGFIVAVAMSLLMFEKLHIITLSFGAGLVGVSIDYALHFLCANSACSKQLTLNKIFPSLMLGLFSSVSAYLALFFTPFPGLQQMAFFSAVGLSAAWITVVLWFPLLSKTGNQKTIQIATKLHTLIEFFPNWKRNPKLISGIILSFFLYSTLTLWFSNNDDDIRMLQTSPASLLEQESIVQQQLGGTSSSKFLLVQCTSIEDCLQKEEALKPTLQILMNSNEIGGIQALSDVLPSVQRQNKNHLLVKELYNKKLESLYQAISLSSEQVERAELILRGLSNRTLSFQSWDNQLGNQVWKNRVVKLTNGDVGGTIISLSGKITDSAVQQLTALSINDDSITFVDRVKDISDLLENYRENSIIWLTLAYLFVFMVLLFRYRSRIWRIGLALAIVPALTLAIVSQIELGINLFHLMALVLVLGIGIDMGIFLIETNEANTTWLAVSLSAYTSLFAFGLLTLSNIPVLHHFGITVLIGLSLTWLLMVITRDT